MISVGCDCTPEALAIAIYSRDAFGRFRTSEPVTLADITHAFDINPLSISELTATGATSTYQQDESAVDMNVTTTVGSRIVRQSRRYFVYQAGKSLLIFQTGVLTDDATNTGVRSRIGYFDDDNDKSVDAGGNGFFFQYYNNVLSVVKRSFVTGAQVDTVIPQSSWNIDKLDGTTDSGITIDVEKAQIFFMDLEWLGVGSVRLGVVINGVPYYVHQFNHANVEETTYMTRAILPVRYEIEQVNGGVAGQMKMVCMSVSSEGGHNPSGRQFGYVLNNTVTVNTTEEAILAIRPRAGYERVTMNTLLYHLGSTTNDTFVYRAYVGSTVTGGAWANVNTDSAAEVNTTMTAFSGGRAVDVGIVSAQTRGARSEAPLLETFGADIDGTPQLIVLTAQNLAGAVNVVRGMTWEEIW